MAVRTAPDKQTSRKIQRAPLRAPVATLQPSHAADAEAQVQKNPQRVVGNQVLQRAGARAGGSTIARSHQSIQRLVQRSVVRRSGVGPAGGVVDEDLQARILGERGRGRPLERGVAQQMGGALGADFGGVQVHADAASDKLNRSLNAEAFTLGNDLFFRSGAYNPGSSGGRQLLAHELTHVVQQGGAPPQVQTKRLTVGPANDQYEAEANRVASGVQAGTIQAHHAGEEELQRSVAPFLIQRHEKIDPIEKEGQEAEDEVQDSREASAAPEQTTSSTKDKKKKGGASGLSFKTLDTAYAQKAIEKKFGKVKKNVITGDVVVIATRDELYAKQDEVEKRSNPDWVDGTCKRLATEGGYDVNGFAELPPKTEIYVFGGGPDPTATVHEMMHINTIPGFLDNVGRVINEGLTQRFAMMAVKGTGQKTKGSESVYPDEQAVVKALVKVIPEPTLIKAYFTDNKLIPAEYDKVKGKDAFAQLKAVLDQNKYDDGKALISAKVPKPDKGSAKGGKGATTGGDTGSGGSKKS